MNTTHSSSGFVRAQDALASLAEKPWTLFLVLLTINTLSLPYAGITHDSRLYSAQVLNHVEPGAYAEDLFFRYGSQDEYSLFSHLAAPLVRWLGLSAGFFVIYVLSKCVLVGGMQRLVQTLVPNRAASTLALVYSMAVSIHYGGHHVLKIQESFVTPRMLAIGLVLLGLDLVLRRRPLGALGLLLLACAIHPLMGFGGLLIWTGFHLWSILGGKVFAAMLVVLLVLAGMVLLHEPLGKRCFGEMDAAWQQSIRHASAFNFPSEWSWEDWYYLGFQFVILGVVIGKVRAQDPERARFLIVLLLVTLAGTGGAMMAEKLPYALLLQGQPYRTLWILALVHLALVFWLALEWSRLPTLPGQLAGGFLLAYLCWVDGLEVECWLPVFFFPLLVVGLRGLEKKPLHPDWLLRSLQYSSILGALGWAAYKFFLLASGYPQLQHKHPEGLDILAVFLINLGPIVFIAGLSVLLLAGRADFWQRPVCRWGLAGFCLGMQLVFFALPQTDYYRAHHTRYRADLRVVHDLVHRQRLPGQPLPTVYCNLGCLDYVWIDLHAQSYFDWWQAGNFMFRREMAAEGQRRAGLVAPFELERYRQLEEDMSEGRRHAIERFFHADFNRGPVVAEDIARLCQEPHLDFLLLGQHVEGLHAVQVGQLSLYSCSRVRAELHLPDPHPSTAVASQR